ncbi:MAG: SIMPL domain-containing protein [Proteobacteria bacterium]|nr:SIMPL domain-containing protein [Pseudomonadota bacterium]
MKNAFKFVAVCALLTGFSTVYAQNGPVASPQNVLQLSASGTVEVQQDLLVLTLSATREASEAAAVQTQLQQALDAALAEARRAAQPQQMDVRTGAFGMYPRYGKDGKISGWQGRAELVLQGRDFLRITGTAAKIPSMSIAQIAFDLSREARAKIEGEAQAKAIEAFKARAAELARGFGFAGYTLREVAVNNNEMAPGPRPRMMAMEAKAASMVADAPVPVEAGKAQVVVNISGSVQLR